MTARQSKQTEQTRPESWPAGQLNSLGFAKPPQDTKVVVAMSGGVDSSVVAALLHEAGYEVVGITLQLYDHGAAVAARGACCAGADIHDARSVAAGLGIPHFVLDYESKFKAGVMEGFADAYLAGHTPIPCVRCNQTVKFTDLLDMARDLEADCLATGHYVRRVQGLEGPELLRGVDAGKDQSYFLFATTAEQLDYLRFPLGGLTKQETRQLAGQFGLSVQDKPDSQDICFVPNGRYGDVVRRLRPGAIEPGEIRHLDGTVLGQHEGVIDYTIGQRKGLGIGGRKSVEEGVHGDTSPLFVVAIDAAKKQVIVGPKEALACAEVHLEELNWLGPEMGPEGGPDSGPEAARLSAKARKDGLPLLARLRNTGPAMPARLVVKEAGEAVLYLDEPQFGIAPGQAGVLYDAARPEQLLGGGWIKAAPAAL